MSITNEEARKIADEFLGSAEAIDKFLDDNFQTIDRAYYETLSEEAKTLLRVSSFLTTKIVGMAIKDMKQPGETLENVVVKAKDKLKTLKNVGVVIRVVAAIVNLGTSLLLKEPGAIIKSVNDLVTVVEKA